jgi:hypothetical protein
MSAVRRPAGILLAMVEELKMFGEGMPGDVWSFGDSTARAENDKALSTRCFPGN